MDGFLWSLTVSEVPVQTVVDMPGQQGRVPELFVALRAGE